MSTVVVIGAILWLIWGRTNYNEATVTTTAQQGEFRIVVTTTGELEARHSEDIFGPSGLREFRIWQVRITDIIPDGTVVDSGDYVATLDRSDLINQMKDLENELEKLQSQHTQTELDTALDLRSTREALINMKYTLEELQIRAEQSIYEPPATQRQIQIDLSRGTREYEQSIRNYDLKLEKARATMQEVSASLQQAKRKYRLMQETLKQFTIHAPKAGMVIHKRNWDGTKQGIGSTVNVGWNNAVASLPNLAEMISKTYVNEIDISKIKVGQHVELGVDAFPDKKYSGTVIEIANIGEQLRNSNTKVFEVRIAVNESDPILRPAMTTKNMIITEVLEDVVFIPLEALFVYDTISYVYRSGKEVRQEVRTGSSNENEIVIMEGLNLNDEIYLAPPERSDEWKLIKLPKL